MSSLRVAVVGVTGAVGQEMLSVLETRRFPVGELVPLASERSRGKKVDFAGSKVDVRVLDRSSFEGIDLALFSAGGSISKELAPVAAKAGALVVDNSSAFRMDPEVPLIVPEVNAGAIPSRGIIANPNCTTIILVVAIAPIHALSPLTRITASTYQAASGAGARGMDALERELAGEGAPHSPAPDSPFPHRLLGNVIPRVDSVDENGYTREELKMVHETRKIMGLGEIPISATCVRSPVSRAHSASVQITTEKPLELEAIRAALEAAPGVTVLDRPADDVYPMPIHVSGEDDVFVGRIRRHPSDPCVTDLWIVGDQVRKGAALNAVQIAEQVFCPTSS